MAVIKDLKVLEHRPYQSIGHFSKSRLGSADKHIDANTERHFLTDIPNQQCLVIVQEKLDGSNVSVVLHGDELIPMGRAGYRCQDSDQEQHRMFYDYVMKNEAAFMSMLRKNERIVGEWLALAHGTIYNGVKAPFVPFDIFTANNDRLPFLEFHKRVSPWLDIPTVLHMGGSCSLGRAERLAKRLLGGRDYEGFVYRLEEAGKFKAIAKYVRQDKVDGLYLDKEDPLYPRWNWRPDGR